MRIGIGLGRDADPERAAERAARAALLGAPRPDLTIAFGSIRLDQKAVHRGLTGVLDPARLIGGSSYAEISNAGVTEGTVAALSLSFDDAPVRFAQVGICRSSNEVGDALARGLGPAPAGERDLALYFGSVATGRDNDALVRARAKLGATPFFGGLTCGDYDLGISHPRFWDNRQYGPKLTKWDARAALVGLPGGYELAFGFEHGWEPVGPPVTITRARGEKVYEIGGVPVFEYYRRLLGDAHDDKFFELLIQRYGFSMLAPGGRTLLKLAVACDFKRGFIQFFPAEDMQGRSVRLILASRRSLVSGARVAAERCRAALHGRRPDLL